MAMKIRLARGGSKKRPHYAIVASDSRMPATRSVSPRHLPVVVVFRSSFAGWKRSKASSSAWSSPTASSKTDPMTSYPTVTLSRREIDDLVRAVAAYSDRLCNGLGYINDITLDDLKTRSSEKAKVWKGRS